MRQIPFELLREDKIFRAWIKAVPSRPEGSYRLAPWQVFVQVELDGRWSRICFDSYPQAYNWLAKRRLEFWDYTINCKVKQFKPPIVKRKTFKPDVFTRHYWPGVTGHQWCGFCRRPTIFKHFSKHHNVPHYYLSPADKYCSTCGARQAFVKIFATSLTPIDDLWLGGQVPKELSQRIVSWKNGEYGEDL